MVASSVDAEKEETVRSSQEVNSSSYQSFHNAQMFADGFSFSGFERNKLWLGSKSGFVDLSTVSGADTPNDSRAVLAADFDDDGDTDLFVHNIQRERHNLYRNDAVDPKRAGFLKLRLRATIGHWEAIGAEVRVDAGDRTATIVYSRGAGYASCQAPERIFGLGGEPSGRVEVLWPNGERESFGELPSGTRAWLVQGTGEAKPFAPKPRVLADPLPKGLKLDEGDLLTKLTLAGPDGTREVVDLVELADGKSLFVNFWASYCAPCVAEIPDLQALEDGGEVRVLGISVDVEAAVPDAVAILERAGAGYANRFIDPSPPATSSPDAPDLRDIVDLERLSIPTTLVLTAEGRVESILRGPIESAGD